MKKIKKLLCLIVVVLFTFSMVIVSKAAQPVTDHSKPYAMQVYFIGGNQPSDADEVMDEADKYLKDKINATIKFTIFDYGDFPNKMSVKCASNEKFDIMFTSYWTGAVHYNTCVSNGYIISLTDLLDKYAPKTKAALGKSIIKACSVGGKLYAIPVLKKKAHSYQLIYCRDIAQKLKLDMSKIKTLADAEEVFKIVKKKEPKMYPYQPVVGESYGVLDFERINGECPGAIYSPAAGKKGAAATKVVNDYGTPEAMQFFKLMYKWNKLDFFQNNPSNSMIDDLRRGRTFSIVGPNRLGEFYDYSGMIGERSLAAIDITPIITTARDASDSMMAVSKTSEDPVRALEFLELLNSDKYLNNLMLFGIEGKHYQFTNKDKGIIKLIGDGYASYYSDWSQGNQYLNYLTDKEDPEKWIKIKKYNVSALFSPLPLFFYDPKAVKKEIIALTKIRNQYIPSLEMGRWDPSKYIPIINSKFKANGIKKVLSDMQKQVDKAIGKR